MVEIDADGIPQGEGGVQGGLLGEGHVVHVGEDVGGLDALAGLCVVDLNGSLVGAGGSLGGSSSLNHEAADRLAEGVLVVIPVGAGEGADEDVACTEVHLTLGIHAVAAVLRPVEVGDVGIVGNYRVGVHVLGGIAVVGDVAVLDVVLHAQLGGQGLALAVGEVGDLDGDLSDGGGVQEELTALDLVLGHLNGVGLLAVILARGVVAGHLLGEMIEPQLHGGVVVGGGDGRIVGNGVEEGHVHGRAVAQLVLLLQGGVGQVGGQSAVVDGQLAEAVDRSVGLVLDEQVHLVAHGELAEVEGVAVAGGVGKAFLLSGLHDSGLTADDGCALGGVGYLAVGADTPAQLVIINAEADPTVQDEVARFRGNSDLPVAGLLDLLGIIGLGQIVLDGVQAYLADDLLGIGGGGVSAVARGVDLGRLGLGFGLCLGLACAFIRVGLGGLFGGGFLGGGLPLRRCVGFGLGAVGLSADYGTCLGACRGRLAVGVCACVSAHAGCQDQHREGEQHQNKSDFLHTVLPPKKYGTETWSRFQYKIILSYHKKGILSSVSRISGLYKC